MHNDESGKNEIKKCKYCGKKMHKFDFEMYQGHCGKCREVLDWKNTLDNLEEFEK